jgi:hypothetical protein
METSWCIVLLVLLAAIALIAFIIKRNKIDEADLIKDLENEEEKNKPEE